MSDVAVLNDLNLCIIKLVPMNWMSESILCSSFQHKLQGFLYLMYVIAIIRLKYSFI